MVRLALVMLTLALVALALAFVSCQSVESFDDTREWTEPELVDDGNAPALRHDITLDDMGHAIVVWDQTDRGTFFDSGEDSDDIWWARSNAPISGAWDGWSAPARLDDTTLNEPCDSVGPQIGLGGDGSLFVVFIHDATIGASNPNECEGQFGVWAVRRGPGGDWETPECIQDDDCLGMGDTASNPQIAVDSVGNAMVVWQESNSASDLEEQTATLWWNRYSAGVGWEGAKEIDDLPRIAQRPQLGVDGNGDALLLWEQVGATDRSSVSARWVRANGDLETPQPLELFEDGHALDPQVAVNAAGEAIAVWKQQQVQDGLFETWANRYEPSTEKWTGEERIDPGHDGDTEWPQISINESGDGVAVWVVAGFRGRAWSNRYTTSGGWGSADPIGPLGLGSARRPQVALNDEGWAAAVWVQHEGTLS